MQTAVRGPIKSILKKQSTHKESPFFSPDDYNLTRPQSIPAPKTDEEAIALRTALHHANLLEDKKRLQREVIQSIELLSLLPDISFPPSLLPPSASAYLDQDPRMAFCQRVSLFQTSDYISLLQERTINSLCSYALCPNPPRSLALFPSSRSKLSFLASRIRSEHSRESDKNMNRLLEHDITIDQFCSNLCAQRAMYVLAQLRSTPCWERQSWSAADNSGVVKLLDNYPSDTRIENDNRETVDGEEKDKNQTNQESEEEKNMKKEELEKERIGNKLTTKDGVLMNNIVERNVNTTTRKRVEFGDELIGGSGQEIEGYLISKMRLDSKQSNQ